MTSRIQTSLRTALVFLTALGGYASTAEAQNTPADTLISNRATVNYSVGGQPQTQVNSSPAGNTTPGAAGGADTEFRVDNRVDLNVAEVSTNATITAPGAANAVLTYRVTNTGNAPQGYALTFTELGNTSALFGRTDNADFGNLVIRVDEDPPGPGTGNGTYDGTETDTAIDTLAPGQSRIVFVVSPTVPLALLNLSVANVRLQAVTAVPGTNGGTVQLATPAATPNGALTVEVLFADNDANPNDGIDYDDDQYFIQTAALSIQKTQTVISDPFGSANPRSLPGSVVEYTITIVNNSTTTAADALAVTDPIPANTTFLAGPYAGGTDVAITGAAAPTCIADTPDTNGDGCSRTPTTLTVGGASLGNIAAGATVTVRFRVTIN